ENLTAVIKTFERPKIVRRLVRSIRRFYPDLPVIVVDDSLEPTRIDGVKTIVMPYDSGVSAGRNAGVREVKTPYLLMLDDDYVFYRKTGLIQAMEIIHAESDIDILGGARIDLPFYRIVDHGQSVLFPTMRTSVLPVGSTVGGLPVYDKVAQFFIARTERIRQVMWDEELKRIDHADFFTRAKGRLVTVYFAGLRCLHAQSRFDENYLSKRLDTGDYSYLRKKYYRDRDSAT
ncbi:MAG: glycosyltransferase family 2 protein, partial [Desulfopila sp.]|nr:glycosyltransferase family 2 protein [Desulfopila sp.]